MKRSILFDARLVLEKPTGIGQYIVSLLPEMIKQAPDWHFHLLRRPASWSGYDLVDWSTPNLTHHISNERHMSLHQHIMLPRFAQLLGVNVLHYPHFDAPVIFGSVPVVATLHDAKYLVRPEFFTNMSSLKRMYMRFSFGQTLRRSEAVIADSHATADDLHQLFKTPLSRIQVIYAAADPRFKPASLKTVTDFRMKFKVRRPFILTVGERRPHKNQSGLIHAYAQSHSRQSHDLLVVGQVYQDYAAPEEAARELGVEERVHLLDNLNFDDLVAAYTSADLFVLVSLYEGFGLPILEAMQCDTPVIAAGTTAAGEILGDGGLSVNPRDRAEISAAIDSVLQNPERRQELISHGRQWRPRFSWTKAAAQTLQIYEQMID